MTRPDPTPEFREPDDELDPRELAARVPRRAGDIPEPDPDDPDDPRALAARIPRNRRS